MPEWLQWSLIILGVAAIAVLAVFIVRHSRQLFTHRRQQERRLAFQAERRQSMIDSIRILAMSIEENQVEYSEACLRIKGLLDHVEPELLNEAPYRIFQEVHDRIQHMPTHQARQDTDTHFVRKMDKERYALEKEHADEIRRAATAIRHREFNRLAK